MTDKEAIIRTAEQPNSRTFHDSRKLRVLYVTHTSCYGGATPSLLGLMLDMKNRHNVDPTLLIHKDANDNRIQNFCLKNGIKLYLQNFQSWTRGLDGALSPLKGLVKNFLNKIYYHRKILSLLHNQR